MKRGASVFWLTVVCFTLGVLVMVQLRSASRAADRSLSTADQAQVLAALVESNAGLRREIAELEAQRERLREANNPESNTALVADLNRLLVVTGLVEVGGPGVRVTVSGLINPLDMQDLLNELRNAGAEAIALNGRRVTVRSVVARDDSALALDSARLTPPYLLEAIGHPDTMEKALLRRGGLVSLLEYAYPGLRVSVTKVDGVFLSAHQVDIPVLKYAQPLQ